MGWPDVVCYGLSDLPNWRGSRAPTGIRYTILFASSEGWQGKRAAVMRRHWLNSLT